MEDGKMSFRTKLLLGGIGGSFVLVIIFIVVIIATLMVLGIIDVEGVGSPGGGLGYSDISTSSGYWWPIGSTETETKNGKIYASGAPVSSKSETYPDGVSSYFGPREAPTEGASQDHGAIDIPVPEGTNVIAPLSGTISYVNTDPSADGCGIYIQMDDIKGNKLLFCHLSQVKKSVGDEVEQGEVIALSGNTGASTGPHLHFGMTVNGVKVDPLIYVDIDNPRPAPKYDFGDIASGYGSSSENQSAMCKILLNAGYSENAVAAVLTNISHEGGFLTNNLEDCYEINNCCYGGTYGYCIYGNIIGEYGTDTKYTAGIDSGNYPRSSFVSDHAGYGLIQWTSSDRKAGLYDLAKEEKKSIADIGVQTKHLFNELSKPSYARTMDAITSSSRSASDISLTFCDNFESPRGGCSDRGPEAENKFLPYVKNGCQ